MNWTRLRNLVAFIGGLLAVYCVVRFGVEIADGTFPGWGGFATGVVYGLLYAALVPERLQLL